MKVLIIGSEGAQGKRYKAILKFLKKDYGCSDLTLPFVDFAEYSHFLIATPTGTHAKIIRELLPYGKPILCEKPVTKNIYEMRDLYEEIKRANVSFSMVYQYRHLVPVSDDSGHSYYNYFRHGQDGLIWDCLQIIGHAKANVCVQESSPIWQCEINGHRLSLQDMDMAYVTEVREWLMGRGMNNLEEILAIHEKVNKFHLTQCKAKQS